MCRLKLLKMLIIFSLTRLIMPYNSANILKTLNDVRHCIKEFQEKELRIFLVWKSCGKTHFLHSFGQIVRNSPILLMWKSCGKTQFLHSFGQIVRNYAKTVLKLGEITVPKELQH